MQLIPAVAVSASCKNITTLLPLHVAHTCSPVSPACSPAPYATGIVELCLAALWHFWLGVALGFGVAKMGTSLCGMTLAARPPPPPARGCFGWLKNLGRRALMWGASKMQVGEAGSSRLTKTSSILCAVSSAAACCNPHRLATELPASTSALSPLQALFFFFRWLIYGYGLVVLLMLLIHVASPDYRWADFPSECPADKRFGCRCGSMAARLGRAVRSGLLRQPDTVATGGTEDAQVPARSSGSTAFMLRGVGLILPALVWVLLLV